MNPDPGTPSADAFLDDVSFLQKHGDVIVLSNASGAKVAVMPRLQGRVMTSTTGSGDSFGWINRSYFAEAQAGKFNPHISPFGGEDRFWLGPEGGQFSIFFKKGDAFDFENWKTPACIDTEAFDVVGQEPSAASFRRSMQLVNHSGTSFNLSVDRTVSLLDLDKALSEIQLELPDGVKGVAMETSNRVTNVGSDWSRETGLLSIWILSMLNASPTTTVAIPVVSGDDAALGKKVNDDYFGTISSARLKAVGDVVYFKADAKSRGKIGISPARTKQIVASYDSAKNVLTICTFTFHKDAADYVNSAWKHQEDPYNGDVINSYNDGAPPTGGAGLGNFYEIETSSTARELKGGESIDHSHRIIHLTGDRAKLDAICRKAIGVGLDEIAAAFA